MLSTTSTSYAPWFILPADDKWFTRVCLGEILYREFEKLKLNYPEADKSKKKELLAAKQKLLNEK